MIYLKRIAASWLNSLKGLFPAVQLFIVVFLKTMLKAACAFAVAALCGYLIFIAANSLIKTNTILAVVTNMFGGIGDFLFWLWLFYRMDWIKVLLVFIGVVLFWGCILLWLWIDSPVLYFLARRRMAAYT